jgi:hypothetical protein
MRQTIWVTWQSVGFHCYPHAPPEVNYLSFKHRHIFHFRVELEVHPGIDRELEFHMVRTALITHTLNRIDLEDCGSCESLCSILTSICQVQYPNRMYSITVSEEGECGATRYERS